MTMRRWLCFAFVVEVYRNIGVLAVRELGMLPLFSYEVYVHRCRRVNSGTTRGYSEDFSASYSELHVQ
jgi:hypothetical protein